MKRECSVSNKNLKSKLGFVKLIQGLANAHLAEERFIIIGADQKERKFFPVENAAEFDPANLSAILTKYLEPLPSFEAFNSLTEKAGSSFVLIVLAGSQPRPIVVKADVETDDPSVRIRTGEIWIKESTRLRPAIREDLEAMYRARVEAEAESRSRARFAVLRDELNAQFKLGLPAGARIPTKDILFGKDEDFHLFVQELIARGDNRPFFMLLETMRDTLVEGWRKLDACTPGSPPNIAEFVASVADYKKNQFLPTLRRLVQTGLLLVKHDIRRSASESDSFGPDWFEAVAKLLVEVFETTHRLERLESIEALIDWGELQLPEELGDEFADVETLMAERALAIHAGEELGHEFPALETLIAARALAIYAIKRERYEFLPSMLKRLVRAVGRDNGGLRPFCFWPLHIPSNLPNGRDVFCWDFRVRDYWGEYFGNRESYLESGCQFEFILELNSFIGVGLGGKKARVEKWLNEFRPGVSFYYQSDLVLRDLRGVIPMAERIYEALERGPDDALICCITVDKTLTDILLKDATKDDRLLLLGRYLQHLRKAQADYYSSTNRLPRGISWGSKLESLIRAARKANGETGSSGR